MVYIFPSHNASWAHTRTRHTYTARPLIYYIFMQLYNMYAQCQTQNPPPPRPACWVHLTPRNTWLVQQLLACCVTWLNFPFTPSTECMCVRACVCCVCVWVREYEYVVCVCRRLKRRSAHTRIWLYFMHSSRVFFVYVCVYVRLCVCVLKSRLKRISLPQRVCVRIFIRIVRRVAALNL